MESRAQSKCGKLWLLVKTIGIVSLFHKMDNYKVTTFTQYFSGCTTVSVRIFIEILFQNLAIALCFEIAWTVFFSTL